jgi:hypothetical protein
MGHALVTGPFGWGAAPDSSGSGPIVQLVRNVGMIRVERIDSDPAFA